MKTAILSILLVAALIFGFSPVLKNMMLPDYPNPFQHIYGSGGHGDYFSEGSYRTASKEYERALEGYETALTTARFISFGLAALIVIILYQDKKKPD